MHICQNCGKHFERNEQWIETTKYCSYWCNMAVAFLDLGCSIEEIVSCGCVEVAAKMVRNISDGWAFEQAVKRLALKEIERLETL